MHLVKYNLWQIFVIFVINCILLNEFVCWCTVYKNTDGMNYIKNLQPYLEISIEGENNKINC